jgi:hypothetical protein
MSTIEYPVLPKNVSYISLEGTPVNSDSPFPEIRLGNGEYLDSHESLFEFKKNVLVGHYRKHIHDLSSGKYDYRWPVDKVEVNRAREIDDYQKEIIYLENLKDDEAGRAYAELWYHTVDDRDLSNSAKNTPKPAPDRSVPEHVIIS